MEESLDVYSDENNAFPEKKQKRKVKTPSQIEALENLYNEHKYPSDSMKLQLSEVVGLTEKQISGWFCHRRLKDKKLKDDTCAHGRQDRSSGVIQERGSGLKEDSCGSTKQGEYKHNDPREVESRRFNTGEEFPGTDITNELGSHYIQNHSDTDDTSSGSRAPQDCYFPQNTVPLGVVTSRNMTQKGNIVPIHVKGSQGRTGPSGSLKIKGHIENVAITSVKRQLGRHYREDGPPLGVDFEQLPPGAFESPTRDPVDESNFIGKPILFRSSYDSRTCKQPHPGMGYEEYNSKMGSHNSDLNGTSFELMHGSNSRENYSHFQFEKNLSLSHHRNPVQKRGLSMEMNEDSAGEALVHDIRKNYGMRAKDHAGGTKESVFSHHLLPSGRKQLTSKQRESWSSNRGDVSAKVTRGDCFEASPSNLPVKHNKYISLERGLSRRASKEGDIYSGRRGINDYHEPVKVTVRPADEIRLGKRSREDFPQQQYATKAAMEEMTPLTNPSRRFLAEVPSSFSEDETGETSSSVD